MADPFTIRIYVPDGDPDGVRIVDRMNWTGKGVAFPRALWPEVQQRPEFSLPGVYILSGYTEGTSDDLPTIYVGKAARTVRSRVNMHFAEKDFWDTGVAFVSPAGGLNAAHVEWLEYALVKQAAEAGRCHLENGTSPKESPLTEAETADTRAFLKEVLLILPLLGIHSFEKPKAVQVQVGTAAASKGPERDTIVVPAHSDGFEEVFIGEDCWYAIRIAGGMMDKIRYIAAYQTAPVGAITHYARVKSIEPYGDEGKYKLLFDGKAAPIGPIEFGKAKSGSMQGPRYTTFEKLQKAKTITELFK